jgi:hypothetical protein
VFRAADAIASAIPRSAPGSSIRTPAEHGYDHRKPLRIDARADASWHGEIGGGHESLDLEQQRPRPLERADDSRSWLILVDPAEDLGRIGDADEAVAGHLEDAQLVRRAEAVLDGSQDPVRPVAVAFEMERAVHQVLEDARPRDSTLFRHMADEEHSDPVLLGEAEEPGGGFADLCHRAGRRAELRRVQSLDGVDDRNLRAFALERRADVVEVCLGQDVDVPGAAQTVGAELYLRGRLLPGHQQGLAVGAHRRESH